MVWENETLPGHNTRIIRIGKRKAEESMRKNHRADTGESEVKSGAEKSPNGVRGFLGQTLILAKEFLGSTPFIDAHKRSPADFTRGRKLTFEFTMLLLLQK